jgi:hypothetical protein
MRNMVFIDEDFPVECTPSFDEYTQETWEISSVMYDSKGNVIF